jgi:hypothetical protein
MPRQTLPKTTAPGAYAGEWEEVVWTAADPTDKEQFTVTGREVLLIRNTSADTPYHATITSVDDPFGRSEDISAVDIPFGDTVVWGPTRLEGWQQSDGNLYLEAENAAIEFAVVTI